jgi:two-component system, sporulation sensor kinase D
VYLAEPTPAPAKRIKLHRKILYLRPTRQASLNMNLYSNKQRWKIFLLALASVIVVITLWYSNHIAQRIRAEERQKVELWSEAIKRRAELVVFTQKLFDELKEEERNRVDLLGKAYSTLVESTENTDLTLISELIQKNISIPVLVYDDVAKQATSLHKNLTKPTTDKIYVDSLVSAARSKNNMVSLSQVGQKIYYDDSHTFRKLQRTMSDLINSFISETVINSASVPVVVTDSTQTIILKKGNIDTLAFATQESMVIKLNEMRAVNAPIELVLPGQGRQFIFYEDSEVLKQLQLFPVLQLILIGVFLLSSYLIFSTFRKAEQNQVWVGMAKETAHQLGTPLSSLMAWSALLETQGVDKSSIEELNKDIDRLNTITDRFSKIGSVPELHEVNLTGAIREMVDYLDSRVSKKVEISVTCENPDITAHINKPLFSWVIENIVKNAIDAMDGVGKLNLHICEENNRVCVDITDTGKGIPKHQWRTVFEPGFTTKKRGWGLGLSLVKRIIKQYHEGRIYVKWSEAGGRFT